jgi:protein-disulfide isomerase
MNRQTLLYSTLGIIAMFVFLVVAYMLTSKPQTANSTEYPELKKVLTTDHVKWAKKSKNILVEYSDLQCPGCQYLHQILAQLEKDPGFKEIEPNVTFVYKHFPLDNLHPNARVAAYAAEAASKQGKFFEFSDILFTKQTEWNNSNDPQKIFESYAKSLKLDIKKFQDDSKSKETQDKVQNDFVSGTKVNIEGTPSFFLNGKLIDTPQTADAWKTFLKANITK